MGNEITSQPVNVSKFLGINRNIQETEIDIKECIECKNFNITEESLMQRNGSTKLNSTAFKDKTNSTAKPITGLYQTKLNGTTYEVGIGGDAIREDSANWNNITGAVTVTESANTLWCFSTFIDTAVADVIVMSNGVDSPIKWTGAGNCSNLSADPGNFKYQVVHKNKLWVSVGDILYFSALRDCETWDTTNDIARFENNGEDITGLIVYGDRIVVFQETAIHVVSGSSNRDLFAQTIVKGDGTKSGFTVKEVESKRYGNILVFLSKDGTLKGFNGTKNLIQISDSAKPLFADMNRGRDAQANSAVYQKLGQYWCSLTYGSGTTNDRIIIYDYLRDIYSSDTGRPLSTILKHEGINASYMAIFNSSNIDILVTGNYDGFALRQDYGLLDEGTIAISSLYRSGKISFGNANTVKLLTDLHISTTQTSDTSLGVTVSTRLRSGNTTLSITGTSSGIWGTMLWGTGLWSGPTTKYNRPRLSVQGGKEGGIYGRYFQWEVYHSNASEAVEINEISLGISSLGDQPEYSDA